MIKENLGVINAVEVNYVSMTKENSCENSVEEMEYVSMIKKKRKSMTVLRTLLQQTRRAHVTARAQCRRRLT
jgi:hypothetical protein